MKTFHCKNNTLQWPVETLQNLCFINRTDLSKAIIVYCLYVSQMYENINSFWEIDVIFLKGTHNANICRIISFTYSTLFVCMCSYGIGQPYNTAKKHQGYTFLYRSLHFLLTRMPWSFIDLFHHLWPLIDVFPGPNPNSTRSFIFTRFTFGPRRKVHRIHFYKRVL